MTRVIFAVLAIAVAANRVDAQIPSTGTPRCPCLRPGVRPSRCSTR